MPERRPHLPAFRTRPLCCTSIAGLIYAVGGLNSAGILQLPFIEPVLAAVVEEAPNKPAWLPCFLPLVSHHPGASGFYISALLLGRVRY